MEKLPLLFLLEIRLKIVQTVEKPLKNPYLPEPMFVVVGVS
jgi:hypothetical protein